MKEDTGMGTALAKELDHDLKSYEKRSTETKIGISDYLMPVLAVGFLIWFLTRGILY